MSPASAIPLRTEALLQGLTGASAEPGGYADRLRATYAAGTILPEDLQPGDRVRVRAAIGGGLPAIYDRLRVPPDRPFDPLLGILPFASGRGFLTLSGLSHPEVVPGWSDGTPIRDGGGQ